MSSSSSSSTACPDSDGVVGVESGGKALPEGEQDPMYEGEEETSLLDKERGGTIDIVEDHDDHFFVLAKHEDEVGVCEKQPLEVEDVENDVDMPNALFTPEPAQTPEHVPSSDETITPSRARAPPVVPQQAPKVNYAELYALDFPGLIETWDQQMTLEPPPYQFIWRNHVERGLYIGDRKAARLGSDLVSCGHGQPSSQSLSGDGGSTTASSSPKTSPQMGSQRPFEPPCLEGIDLPDWVDMASVVRGQKLWNKHMMRAAMSLGMSLLIGFSVARFSEILEFSGYSSSPEAAVLRYRQTFFRWLDWFRFQDLENPESNGRKAAFAVRRIHEFVRRKVTEAQKQYASDQIAENCYKNFEETTTASRIGGNLHGGGVRDNNIDGIPYGARPDPRSVNTRGAQSNAAAAGPGSTSDRTPARRGSASSYCKRQQGGISMGGRVTAQARGRVSTSERYSYYNSRAGPNGTNPGASDQGRSATGMIRGGTLGPSSTGTASRGGDRNHMNPYFGSLSGDGSGSSPHAYGNAQDRPFGKNGNAPPTATSSSSSNGNRNRTPSTSPWSPGTAAGTNTNEINKQRVSATGISPSSSTTIADSPRIPSSLSTSSSSSGGEQSPLPLGSPKNDPTTTTTTCPMSGKKAGDGQCPASSSSCRTKTSRAASLRHPIGRLWDATAGVPLSQYDLAEVQLVFSGLCLSIFDNEMNFNPLEDIEVTVGTRKKKKRGKPSLLTPQEKQDMVHCWRFLGFLLGIEDEFNVCESVEKMELYVEEFLIFMPQRLRTARVSAFHLRDAAITGFGQWAGLGSGFYEALFLTACRSSRLTGGGNLYSGAGLACRRMKMDEQPRNLEDWSSSSKDEDSTGEKSTAGAVLKFFAGFGKLLLESRMFSERTQQQTCELTRDRSGFYFDDPLLEQRCGHRYRDFTELDCKATNNVALNPARKSSSLGLLTSLQAQYTAYSRGLQLAAARCYLNAMCSLEIDIDLISEKRDLVYSDPEGANALLRRNRRVAMIVDAMIWSKLPLWAVGLPTLMAAGVAQAGKSAVGKVKDMRRCNEQNGAGAGGMVSCSRSTTISWVAVGALGASTLAGLLMLYVSRKTDKKTFPALPTDEEKDKKNFQTTDEKDRGAGKRGSLPCWM
ncbi:unnamed protein product [Amoebophrya sp. A25]|nr:unnamed protein product [Amoebophrya sp. A25]|eukprot:GSA25T00025494001.1